MKEGWTYKKLGEVCEVTDFVANGSFATLRQNVTYYNEPNYAILVRLADYSSNFDKSKFVYVDEHSYNFLSKSSLKGGEIIMSNVGSIGKCFLCPKLSDHMTIGPNSLLINTPNNEYFLYYFRSETFQKDLLSITSSATLSKFNKTQLKTLTIPLPSLSEQQRIVSRLDAAFSHIDELKANAEKQLSEARALFQKSLAKAMKPKEGWKEKKLIEITHEKCPISYGIVQQGNHIDGGVPVVRPVDMREKYITRENLKCTTQTISDSYKRTILRGDELLLSVRGTTGIISLATPELKGCNVNRGIVPLYFKDQFNKDFLYYEMVSPILQSVFAEKTTGSTLKQINIKDLRLIKLSIPPNSEQQRIVERLDALSAHVRELEENQKKIISECDALKQALLRKVFE